jgi:predicted ATPase
MSEQANRLIVLTGGPGSGKSTLLDALAQAGHSCSGEAGRSIIQQQMQIDGRGLPWSNPELYAELQLCWEIRSYHLALEHSGLVYFDRGIPDILGYLRVVGLPVPDHVAKAIELFRYNRRVFIAPPWPEIYRQDRERRQSFEDAVATYEAMVETYEAAGYELVILPRTPVEERLKFILGHSYLG